MGTQLESKPSLPAELTDEIIGWISASPAPWRDLSTCSLVCKAWLPGSRAHLFHSIQITLDKATRWNAFLKSSHLTSYLRHVEILEKPEVTHQLSYEQMQAQSTQLYQLLPDIAQLTTVNSLCVDVISWVPLEDEHVGQLCAAFRNITDLELRNSKIRDNLQLMCILSHFALLQRVSLLTVKVKAFEVIPEELSGKLSPDLHTIKISYYKAVLGTEDWLCKSYPLTSVRHLELRDIPSGELVSAGVLMCRLGEQLSNLVLSFRSSVDFLTLPTHFQPRYNPKLRSVHLMLDLVHISTLSAVHRLDDSSDSSDASWSWLAHFLSAISAPLDSLTLTLEINNTLEALLLLDWRPLALALDGPQFSLLRNLRVEIPIRGLKPSPAEVQAAVRERLPGIWARGIAEVVMLVLPSAYTECTYKEQL
ncbi:hypothetical protein FB451DRAFT_1227982 [Mycena latifolia]|nr:hypothetical protein FB451DRAFT_1227982 [Mycena latifolia]